MKTMSSGSEIQFYRFTAMIKTPGFRIKSETQPLSNNKHMRTAYSDSLLCVVAKLRCTNPSWRAASMTVITD